MRNQVVYTPGETISYGRLAGFVEKVAGEEMEKEVWSVVKLEEELVRDPNDSLKKYRIVFAKGNGVS